MFGIFLTRTHHADAVHERAEEQEVEDEVFGEPTQLTVGGVFELERGLEHRAVPRERAAVICDEQRAARARHALDAVRLDAEVLLVEEIEERLNARLVRRVEAKVVDLLRAIAHRESPPL